MENSFLAYLQRLELLAFFSGYSLIYAVVLFIAGNQQKDNSLKSRLISLLPFSYALVGILYMGYQLRNLYPDYSIENLKLTIQQPSLVVWGLLSILFWIPSFAKKTVFSLLHSLVFFLFIVRDLFLQLPALSPDKDILGNDFKIYCDSVLLNFGAFAFMILLSFLFSHYKKPQSF